MRTLQDELRRTYADIETPQFELETVKRRGRILRWRERAVRGLGGLGAIAVIGLAAALWPTSTLVPPSGNSEPEISVVPLPDIPGDLAYGFGSAWSIALRSGELWRIDPESREIVTTLDLDPQDRSHRIGMVSVGEGAIWASEDAGRSCNVLKIAPDLSRDVKSAPAPMCWPLYPVGGKLWVSDSSDEEDSGPDYLIGLDPATLEESARVEVGACCVREVIYAHGYMWTVVTDIASQPSGEVDDQPQLPMKVFLQKIDVNAQSVIATYPLPGDTYLGGDQVIGGLVASDDALWVSRPEMDLVHRVDARLGLVVADVVTQAPGPLAILDGIIWVKSNDSLRQVDPQLNSLVGRPIELPGDTSYKIVTGDADLWFVGQEQLVRVTFR